ncbi:MAG: PepSY-associated TM helix domain-containing protein [Acidobacteriota bacterium]
MKLLRKVIFWCHLLVGVSAGLVVMNMAVTGIILAFEPQIVRFTERNVRTVSPLENGARHLGAQALFAKVHEIKPGVKPTSLTLQADPTAAAVITLGREGVLYLNPYTGELIGKGSKTRYFFQKITDWHRWFALEGESRAIGRAITGACSIAFFILAITGIYIWWPKKWTKQQLTMAMVFKSGLKGRARDFNWHTVIGFWCAPILILSTITGIIFSYQWAENLLYTLTGSEKPLPPKSNDRKGQSPEIPNNLDQLWSRAEQQISEWQSISLRLPTSPDMPVTFSISDGRSWNPLSRSQLTLNRTTAEVVKWEPYASFSLGRRLRTWVRPVHTGEALGLLGQMLVCLAAIGSLLLVWTGLSLMLRRLRAWVARRLAERDLASTGQRHMI